MSEDQTMTLDELSVPGLKASIGYCASTLENHIKEYETLKFLLKKFTKKELASIIAFEMERDVRRMIQQPMNMVELQERYYVK